MKGNVNSFEDLIPLIQSGIWKTDDGTRKWIWEQMYRLVDFGVKRPAEFDYPDPIGSDYSRSYIMEDADKDVQEDYLPNTVVLGGRVELAETSPAIETLNTGKKPKLVDYTDSESEGEKEQEMETEEPVPENVPPLPADYTDDDDEHLVMPDQHIEDFYEFSQEQKTRVKKFGIFGMVFYVNFKNMDRVVDYDAFLLAVFSSILEKAYKNSMPDDGIGLELQHPSLVDGPVFFDFYKKGDLTAGRIVRMIEALVQSGREINIGDENLLVSITRVRLPKGRRLKNQRKAHRKQWFKAKCGGGSRATFIEIENTNDNLCFPRAVVTARALIEKNENPENQERVRLWNNIRRGDNDRRTLQKKQAQQLMCEAGLEHHYSGCSPKEWLQIQKALGDEYQIRIFSADCFNGCIYQGKVQNPDATKKIYLYLYDGHFAVISRITGFVEKAYFCEQCNKGYDHPEKHRCVKKCIKCKKINTDCDKADLSEECYCADCNNYFSSDECFNNHKNVEAAAGGRGAKTKKMRLNMSTCQQFRRCKDCGKSVNTLKQNETGASHRCGEVFCMNCRKYSMDGEQHLCYIQKIKEKKKTGKKADEAQAECEGNVLEPEYTDAEDIDEEDEEEHWIRIFFDFETTQEREIAMNKYGPVYAHDVDLCVAVKVCDLCAARYLKEGPGKCPKCGKNEHIFDGKDALTGFCEWLFRGENSGAIAIAHNMRAFDGQFILQHWIKNSISNPPDIIPRGRKIMNIVVEEAEIIIRDSYNFAQMRLAQMPIAFGVTEAKKGYFPHLFNTEENQNYEGPLPEAQYYAPRSMGEKEYAEFYRWYNAEKKRMERTGEKFNLKKELLEYCRSDVEVLTRCCLKFEEEVYQQEGFRLFKVGATMPSACSYMFRKNYMKEDTIAVIPHNGYRPRDNQSKEAIQWLEWLSKTNEIQIQHAKNYGEKEIIVDGKRYKVDGFGVLNGRDTIFEFHGCIWHGCPICYSRRRDMKVPNSGKTMEDAYIGTKQKIERFRAAGFVVIGKWECDLMKDLEMNREIDNFFNTYEFIQPLDPRKAFYGGRTNATKLLHICKIGEKIKYADIVSLYPWANKWGKYPVGHPTIILDNFEPITKENKPYFGLAKCKVLPPRRMFHPILPYRHDKKLLFGLCRKCMETRNSYRCTHSEEERAITETWCTLELDKAVDMGYEIVEMYEVWHWDRWDQHNGKDPNTGLFTGYINANLKMKVEASGWPADVKTPEQKAAFIQGYKDREGIDINPENMVKNPGRRTIAKNQLNSFWGRFGMRPNLPRGIYFTSAEKWFETYADPTNKLVNVITFPENDQMIYAVFQKHEDHVEVMPNTNVVIAVFTTSIARLKLYSYLEQLEERAFYFDTDSIIYVSHADEPDEYEPEIGMYLGQMSDELNDYGQGSYIDRFVAGGPKNYAYRVHKPDGTTKDCMKCRGFTSDYETTRKLNRQDLEEKVEKYVIEGIGQKTKIVRPVIRVLENRQVVTRIEEKEHRVVYDKRVILNNFSTLPFGTC